MRYLQNSIWHSFLAVVVTAVISFVTLPAQADGVIYSSWGKAIKGYDPVAYFKENMPVEGKSGLTHEWMGAKWRFANAANRDAFVKNPEKYAPQYGGYCAWAVSQGYTAPVDPDAWKIVDGKLYLNYSKGVQKQWEAGGVKKLIAAGDVNWTKIKAKLNN